MENRVVWGGSTLANSVLENLDENQSAVEKIKAARKSIDADSVQNLVDDAVSRNYETDAILNPGEYDSKLRFFKQHSPKVEKTNLEDVTKTIENHLETIPAELLQELKDKFKSQEVKESDASFSDAVLAELGGTKETTSNAESHTIEIDVRDEEIQDAGMIDVEDFLTKLEEWFGDNESNIETGPDGQASVAKYRNCIGALKLGQDQDPELMKQIASNWKSQSNIGRNLNSKHTQALLEKVSASYERNEVS